MPPPSSPSADWEPPSLEELHQLLPQYEISALLGVGGMGAVYKGRQTELQRDVAIKILGNVESKEEDEFNFAARFKQEARALAQLDHPAIVHVIDFGQTSDGHFYFVMEFIDGMDIHQYLHQHGGKISQQDALSITSHVLDALGYAHNKGILHRDIKPANILLNQEGRVKIADFGLAKKFGEAVDESMPSLTTTDATVGTPDFVAPEALITGKVVDQRADLYAVGVMLYRMLTGKLPRESFKMPSELSPGVDPRLDAIVEKATESDPEYRYASAAEIRADIDQIISQPITQIEAGEAEEASPAVVLNTEVVDDDVVARKTSKPEQKDKPRIALHIGIGLAALLVIGGLTKMFIPKHEGGDSKSEFTETYLKEKPTTATFISEGVVVKKIALAGKDKPFENSLDMRFVPVPITGGPTDSQRVLFSIWETRVQDYEEFIKDNREREWPEVGWKQKGDHPAVNVSWEDAQAFCAWLTEEDREKGKLGKDERYRLPSDHEWSCAVGIGKGEDAALPPVAKYKKINNVFPWGTGWPPPKGAGNYYGEESKRNPASDPKWKPIEDYNDSFERASPGGSFEANEYGLYDMSGNVWEWCEDWLDLGKERRVTRGAAWGTYIRAGLLSAHRRPASPNTRSTEVGFRVVLDTGS